MRLISGYRDFGYGVHDYDIPRPLLYFFVEVDREAFKAYTYGQILFREVGYGQKKIGRICKNIEKAV